MIGDRRTPDPLQCSRARCSHHATWQIRWRNPKIHTEDRVKIWLACDEHKRYLVDFLGARSFPLSVVPLEDASS